VPWHRNNVRHVGPMGRRGTEIMPHTSAPWGGVAANVLKYRNSWWFSYPCRLV